MMFFSCLKARIRSAAIVIAAPAVLLGACATPLAVHQELPDGARTHFTSTDVVLPVKQSEIYVFVPASNMTAAAGGGLLWAIADATVDSIRNAKAETAVKPLRDSMVDYNFDTSLKGQVGASLVKLTWMKANSPEVLKEVTSNSFDAAVAQSKADAVLFATTDYHLSNDGYILDITLNTDLFARSDALKAVGPSKLTTPVSAPANALYRNVLTYETTLPMGTVDRDKNITLWSADHGAAMRKALDKGATKLAELLADDLEGKQPAPDSEGTFTRAADGTIKFVAAPGH